MIDILVVTNGEQDFFELLLKSLEKTHGDYRVLMWANNGMRDYDHPKVEVFSEEDGRNIGHGVGLDKLIQEATSDYSVIMDADAHILVDNWDDILLNYMKDNDLKLLAAEGGKLKPIRPAFMIWKTDVLKEVGSMGSWSDDRIWFDTGIKAYFTLLSKHYDKSVGYLRYAPSPFEGVWGECYTFGGTKYPAKPFVFHHYYGSRFGASKQELDGRKREDFEASKQKLFNLYAKI